ncbi:MAG: methyl-accepting chemotaxis protein [Marinobacter sp.]|nr:methyl-accepting chemotaxis protein [Marinobacter sp.]
MPLTGKLSNLSVGKKLTGGFAFLVFLAVMIAIISIQTFSQYSERSLIVAAVSFAESSLLDARTDEKNFRLRRESQYIESAKLLANSAATKVAPLKEVLIMPADRKQVDTIIASVKEYSALLDKFEANISAAPYVLLEIESNLQTVARRAVETARALQEVQLQRMKKQYNSAITMLVVVTLVAVLVAALIAWLLTRAITRPVNEVVEIANKVASGNLTVEVRNDRGDEFGQLLAAFSAMVTNLRELIRGIDTGAASIASASEELSTVTHQTSQGVAEQQSQTDQVATAMNEMVATVSDVARSAEAAFQAANDASEKSNSGEKSVKETLHFVGELSKQSANVMQQLNGLQTATNNIGTVLDVIKSVAEQTNLLALNAAIEAARAGEQGRGFAVVADEVRSLAQRTQSSAGEIETLVENLVSSAETSVSSMETGIKLAEQTLERAEYAGTTIRETAEAVDEIRNHNSQIATAAEQQTSVAEDINKNVTQIRDVGDQSAASAEQVSAASDELAQLAEGLSGQIARFKM